MPSKILERHPEKLMELVLISDTGISPTIGSKAFEKRKSNTWNSRIRLTEELRRAHWPRRAHRHLDQMAHCEPAGRY